MIAPAEAGDPRPMQGIPPPPPPPSPPPPQEVAPAEAGQAFAAAPATAKAWLDAGVDGSSAAATPAEDSTRGGGAGAAPPAVAGAGLLLDWGGWSVMSESDVD